MRTWILPHEEGRIYGPPHVVFLGQGCAVVANRHSAGEGELKWEFMSSWKVIFAGGKNGIEEMLFFGKTREKH